MIKNKSLLYSVAIANILAIGGINEDEIKVNAIENETSDSDLNLINRNTEIKYGIVTASKLNVRNGAGTNYSIIGSISKDKQVKILADENGWYKIDYGETYGYVSSNYITIKEETISTKTGIVKASTLNVRSGTSTNHSIIGKLKNNDKVEIVETINNWYKIKYNGGYGYVSSSYITINTQDSTTETPINPSKPNTPPEQQVIATGLVKADYLNIRSGPSTKNYIVGKLKNNDKVEIVETSNGWYKIKCNGGYGYVSGSYIELNNTTTPPEQKPDEVISIGKVINTDSLNVRSGPSTKNYIIGKLKNNDKVEIVKKESNGWYKIKYNGGYGYVSGSYIELNNTTTPPEQTTDEVISIGKVINTDSLNVRNGASTSYKIIGTLKANDKVEIVKKESNGWYKIKYNGGYGYVSGSYITTNTQDNSTEIPEVPAGSKIVNVTTNYNFTLNEYLKEQQKKNTKYEIDYYRNYIDPNLITNKYQFLRIDTYRDIDVNRLNTYLQGKGVLSGKGEAIIRASKKHNIDPIYFTAQSLHETGNGKSTLAKGVTITEIANTDKEIRDSKGNLIGYEMIKLDKPVTVYNLYGIGAYDNLSTFPNRAVILGTTYAYNKGWTTIDKAIEGASSFVSSNYANSSKYKQNTIYKYRYNPSRDYLWHQYATTPWYADSIADVMYEMRDCYTSNNTFTFDMPVFRKE